MLRGLPPLLQRQHRCAGSILPRIRTAGFAKNKGGDEDVGSDSNYSKALKILEPKPKEKMPRLSVEDEKMWKAATKQYNQLKLAEHRVWQTDLQVKIELKNAALAALPESLRKEAQKTQTELVPLNRQRFTWTPPIPGFSEQQSDTGKRRRRGQQ